jgi:acetylornithine deacetylase/succinyl-diaminopimelate desuccinylase-like protein
VTFVPGRGNLILEYSSRPDLKRVVSFVGSHLDVVPADPKNWFIPLCSMLFHRGFKASIRTVDPFHLTIAGDKLYGRGTTDCLGHVALLTDLFLQVFCFVSWEDFIMEIMDFFTQLAEQKPNLNVKVVAVFIARCDRSR